MNTFLSYHSVVLRLPLFKLGHGSVRKILFEMKAHQEKALSNAPSAVVRKYLEVLIFGEAVLHATTPKEKEATFERWCEEMSLLEEVMGLYCPYELDRWLLVFRGLRLVFEAVARAS
jgi:hypothetical protein